ncbi:helix-turn-helix domain-containing protein [Acidobacteriota bacterium]
MTNETTLFKCDYEKCKRVLRSTKDKAFKCTACGHGTMRKQEPKNKCCLCDQPIYDNVNSNCTIICTNCTKGESSKITYGETPTLGAEIEMVKSLFESVKKGNSSVAIVQYLEKLTGYEFKRARDFRRKMEKYLDGEFFKGEHLKILREEKGWSQELLAAQLDCTQQTISAMESGRRSLTSVANALLLNQDPWHWKWPNIQPGLARVPYTQKCGGIALQTKRLTRSREGKNRKTHPLTTSSPKLICYACGKEREDYEITIEIISPYRTEFICEDCYSRRGTQEIKDAV